MRELGFLLKPLPYSSMTLLYSSVGNRGKVDEILRGMNENNVKLDSLTALTVNSVLRVYAAESDVRSMQKLLAGCEAITMLHVRTALDMVPREKQESIGSERSRVVWGAHEAIREAWKSKDVYRIWNLYKKTVKLDSEGFNLSWILDDIKGVGDMYYKEYEWSGLEFDVRFPTMLVSGFHKKGMMKQADILMKKSTWCKKHKMW